MALLQNFHCQIRFVWENRGPASSIIAKGILQNPDAIFPLAGSVRRRRNRRHAVQHWRGRQTSPARLAGVQPYLVGDHPHEMEVGAAGAYPERALRERVSEGPTLAGYRRGGGSV